MEMNYCRRCGARLVASGEHFVCTNNHSLYINPSAAVGVFFLTRDNKVILGVRGLEPYKGSLATIGGFVDDMETADQALVREIREECGLEPHQYSAFTFLSTETSKYPYQGENRSILSLFYWSWLHDNAVINPSDDVAAIETMPINNLDFSKIEKEDVKEALLKLQQLLQA